MLPSVVGLGAASESEWGLVLQLPVGMHLSGIQLAVAGFHLVLLSSVVMPLSVVRLGAASEAPALGQ